MPAPCAPRGARPAAEDGFTLIEVMVSALLVVIVAISVLSALDGASRASGVSKAKSTAASLAQQDQERLRGKRPSELMALDETNTINADGVGYTVRSKGWYVLERSTTAGCTGGQRDERLGIVTTVDWPGRRGGRPIRVESLMAPPLDATSATQGSAVVRITKADGITAVPGVGVTLNGPQSSLPVATGAEGCAFFANHLVGSYTFTFGVPGWVDPTGASALTLATSIVPNETRSSDVLYDRAGSLTASFYSRWTKNGVLGYWPVKSDAFTVEHSGITTNNGLRTFPAAGTPAVPATSIPGTDLFPFATAYNVFSGSCATNKYAPTRFSLLSSAYPTSRVIAPGSAGAVSLFEPAIDVTVKNASGSANIAGATVTVYSTTTGCVRTLPAQTTDSAGKVADPSVPYGDYKVCAILSGRKAEATVAATSLLLDGLPLVLKLPNSGSSTCAP
jgi:type II secretory pathway pseudopilin PulG